MKPIARSHDMTGPWNKAVLAGTLAVFATGIGCASNRTRELEEQNKTLAAACDDLRRRNDALEKELAAIKSTQGIRDAYIRKLEEESALLKKMLAEMGEPDKAPEGTEVIPGGLRLLGDFFFRSGSDDVSKEGIATLAKIASAVKTQGAYVRIVGHTDNDPIHRSMKENPTGMNLQLGARRAVSVAHELKKAGVDEDRVHVVSMGESSPIAPNDTKENKKKNRRVDIFFSPRPPEGAVHSTSDEEKPAPARHKAPPSK
jgi:flagellar motor protein MotB